jgi:hypothetical protein
MKDEVSKSIAWKRFVEDLEKLNLRFPIAELAKKLDYTQSNVSVFIKGNKIPSQKFLQKFYETYTDDINKANEAIELKLKEKYAETPLVQFPICANCLLKDKEIIELKGQVKLLKELLKDASDNNKSKAISA